MTPLTPSGRCPICFSELFEPEKLQCCNRCKNNPLPLDGIAAVFEHAGPAATLVKQLKYRHKPWLAKGLAAYLTFQLAQLEWPSPDLIIPMPISWLRKLERGYNQSLLIAKELALLLGIPVYDVLRL